MKHTLKYDGAPFTEDGTLENAPESGRKPSTAGKGRAACSCGWLSEELNSRAKRVEAHKEHKATPDGVEEIKEDEMAETNAIEFKREYGANRFFPAMAEPAAEFIKSQGHEATVNTANRTIEVSANKKDTRTLQKSLDALWAETWATFKAWTKEPKNREQRKELWTTGDGKRELFSKECAYLEKTLRSNIEADVL